MDVLNRVPVVGEDFLDLLGTDDRAGVAWHQVLRIQVPHLVHALVPLLKVAEARTADRIEIGESPVEIVRSDQRLLLGQPDHNLVVGFPGRKDQLELDPGRFGFQRIRKGLGGPDKAELAVGLHSDKGSDTHVEHLTRGEKVAVHSHGPRTDDRPDLSEEPS